MAPAVVHISIAGYPSSRGNHLKLERISDHKQITLRPLQDPGLFWQGCEFSLPLGWRGKPVRFLVEHRVQTPDHFFGFTNPESTHLANQNGEAFALLLRTLSSWLVLFLPGYSLACYLVQRGYKDPLILGCTVLAAIGVCGYLSFWMWFFSPIVGQLTGIGLSLGCVAFLVFRWKLLDAPARRLFRHLLVPGALTGGLAILVLSIGFLYGGLDSPFDTAATRFSDRLPPDNQLPYSFAIALARGSVPKPLAGEWLSSDRPPLQTGIYLAQYTASRGRLGYTIVAVLSQCLWIFALWLLLCSLSLNRWFIRLALLVCLFSGFVFLNSFYVWPKLIAPAYTLAFSIFLVSPRYRSSLTSFPIASLAGVLLAFAMLSHGGSMFALLGLFITLFLLRESVPWQGLITIALVAGCLYLPWMAYQKFFDPPGNHLLKMHLAGDPGIDGRSFSQTLLDAYRSLSFADWVSGRVSNLATIFGPEPSCWRTLLAVLSAPSLPVTPFPIHEAAATLRRQQFFYFLPCLGPLMLGPLTLFVGLAPKTRTANARIAARFCLLVASTLFIWCALMFSPGSAVLHQGSYAVVLLACCGSLLAVWALSPLVATLLATAHVLLNLLLYLTFMRPAASPAVVYSGVLRYPMALLAVCSFAFVLRMLQLHGPKIDESTEAVT